MDLRGVILSGPMYSGKDTVGAFIIDKVVNRWGTRFAWADPLKREVADIIEQATGRTYSINMVNKNKVQLRPLLCAWADYRRNQDPDYWVKIAENMMQEYEDGWRKAECEPPILWINTDTRYPNELSLTDSGFICIRLTVSREKQEERMLSRDGKLDTRVLDFPHESELLLKYLDNLDFMPNNTYRVDSDRPLKDVCKHVEAILAQHQVYTVRTLPNE